MADQITHEFSVIYLVMTLYFVATAICIGFVASKILNAIEKERDK